MARPQSTTLSMLPREHGAWAMVLTPFAAALILAKQVNLLSLSALLAVTGVFALKEPLLFLARQRWVWKQRKPEGTLAVRYALQWGLLICLAGIHLGSQVSWLPLGILGAGAALMTAIAVFMAVQNRQRSIPLQVGSAFGLNGSAFAAWASVRQDFPDVIWWLWLWLSAHCVAAVLVVHARLEARIAAKMPSGAWNKDAATLRKQAFAVQWVLLAGAAASLASPRPLTGVPLAFSGAVHLAELHRLNRLETLATPLQKVGWRAVATSLTFATLTLISLLL